MTGTFRGMVLGIGAAALAVALAGVVHAGGQDQGAGGPPPRGGRFGGPGGPGGPGRGRGPRGPMEMGPMADLMLGRLDLTDAQKTRVKEIMDSHRDEQKSLGDRGMAAHQALDAAIAAENFDESAVRTKAADVAGVEADMAVARARIYAEVYQILTTDQQAQLKTLQAERLQRETQMQQRGRGRGPKQ